MQPGEKALIAIGGLVGTGITVALFVQQMSVAGFAVLGFSIVGGGMYAIIRKRYG